MALHRCWVDLPAVIHRPLQVFSDTRIETRRLQAWAVHLLEPAGVWQHLLRQSVIGLALGVNGFTPDKASCRTMHDDGK